MQSDKMRDVYDVDRIKVCRDIPYGSQVVNFTTEPIARPMLMDVYEPSPGVAASARPAIILAFGGAFHRGARSGDSFSAGEASNTSVAEYAAYWASLGFVCFCIDYRLTQEDPDPGTTPFLSSQDAVGAGRMLVVREALGLPPATLGMLANGIEAAADDVALATRRIQADAQRWNINPDRIALWGWSAGARSALNAVFTEGVAVRAVVSASGYMHPDDLRRNVAGPGSWPSLMLVFAERDLPHIREQAPDMISFLTSRLRRVEAYILPDVDHFYPAASSTGGEAARPLLDAMTEFLVQELTLAADQRPTRSRLAGCR